MSRMTTIDQDGHITARTNAEDPTDVQVRITFTEAEVLAISPRAEGDPDSEAYASALTKLEHADRWLTDRREADGADAYLDLPSGAKPGGAVAAWLRTLSVAQVGVLEALRKGRREDTARREQYRIVGIDYRGRPVVQQPKRWGGGLDQWAVLRSGDPTDVSAPIMPIAQVLKPYEVPVA